MVIQEELGRSLEIASRAQRLYAGGDSRWRARAAARGDRRDPPSNPAPGRRARPGPATTWTTLGRAQQTSRRTTRGAGHRGAARVGAARGQLFVRARVPRRLVLALLVATVMAGGFTAYLVGRFRDAREDLRVAGDDTFHSLHLLLRARALAYDAKGDEGRYLLIGPWPALRVRVPGEDRGAVGQPEAGVGGGRRARAARRRAAHIAFVGERDAAQAALSALGEYVDVDGRVRRFETQGQHARPSIWPSARAPRRPARSSITSTRPSSKPRPSTRTRSTPCCSWPTGACGAPSGWIRARPRHRAGDLARHPSRLREYSA